MLLYGATVLVIEVVLQALTHYARSQAAGGPESEVASEGLWHRWWLTPSLLGYVAAICVGLVGFPKIGAVLYLPLAIPGVLLIQVHRRPLPPTAPA